MPQRNRTKSCFVLTGLVISIAVSCLAGAPVCAGQATSMTLPTESQSRDRISRGQAVYLQECATCHGADLKGEAGWQSIGPDGRIKAPPHDETGHTWMHAEGELFRLVKFGPGEAAAPGYVSPMPVYANRLNDQDIKAVLSYLASRWPPGIRAYQIMLEPGFDPAKLPPGDWQLPQICQPEPNVGGQ